MRDFCIIRLFFTLVRMKSFQSCTYGIWILIHVFMRYLDGAMSSQIRNKSHIIVIMADDLGWDDVSYNGGDYIPTPNIDALAYNGVMLHYHYVQPTCTPSRASFLTGKYAIRTGLQGNPLTAFETRALPLNFTLFPEYLRNLGYRTSLIGKWHVGYHAKEFLPTSRGFDMFYGYYNAYINYYTYQHTYSNRCSGYDLHHDIGQNYSVDWTPKDVYATDLFTNKAIKVIADHDPDVPLFLHFSHLAPHTPTINGDEYKFRDDSKLKKFDYIASVNKRSYAATVSVLDESVGRVVEALNIKKMLNDSIIIFMSDNGATRSNAISNFPLLGNKFTMSEGGVRVPALIWSPMIRNSSRVHKGYFHITDWLPTLYKLAGGNIHDLGIIDGIDQWDSISNGSPSPRNSILLNIDELQKISGLIKGQYKYMRGRTRSFLRMSREGDTAAPPYNVTSVTNSQAGLAIAKSNGNLLVGDDKILELRHASVVTCKNPQLVSKCYPHTDCLYDILDDPCESLNIATAHPEVTNELKGIVDDYRKVLMPQSTDKKNNRLCPQPVSSPWRPWLTLEGERLNDSSSTIKPSIDVFTSTDNADQ